MGVGVGVSTSSSTYRISSTWRTGCGVPRVVLIEGRRAPRVRELLWLCVYEWEGRLDRAGEEDGEHGGADGGSGGRDLWRINVVSSL